MGATDLELDMLFLENEIELLRTLDEDAMSVPEILERDNQIAEYFEMVGVIRARLEEIEEQEEVA